VAPQAAEVDLLLQDRPAWWISPTEILSYGWSNGQTGLDFLEAVFRHAYLDFAGEDFIVFGLKAPEGLVDPPPDLLCRFADYPTITSTSETYIPNRGRDSVRHRDFEGRGRAFIIEKLHVIDESAIEVEVRVQGACKWVFMYRFEWRDGHWVPHVLWYRVT